MSEILLAEDDADDRELISGAFGEIQSSHPLVFVKDGEELMDYLHNRGRYIDREKHSRPALILLDLNMPRKDGRQALREIKSDPALRHIPVVVLTTSRAEQDVLQSYHSGANSFIAKPITYEALANVVCTLSAYWLKIVELPSVAQ